MKYIVYGLAIFLLISSIASCGQKKNSDPSLDESSSSDNLASSTDSQPLEMADFPETVFKDIKERFESEGMTLVSLKRSKKVKSGLIEAKVSDSPAEKWVPKAIATIADNFSDIDNIKVISGESSKEYSLSYKKVTEILDKCEKEDGVIDLMLWEEISGGFDGEGKEERAKVHEAGL